MIRLNVILGTENVRILEVDGLVLEGISRVKESLTFSVEFDCISWLIDSACFKYLWCVFDLVCDYSRILLIHILDVTDASPYDISEGRGESFFDSLS